MRYLQWVIARLEGRRAARAVIAIGLALALPSLASPRVADEHLQAIKWRSDPGCFLGDCFVFASGDPAENRAQMEHGHGAWWTPPDFQVAFFRPLSAATHALDLALWPESAALMHAQTLLWLAALLVALGALYRRFLPPRAAILALALYAWDDARGGLLSWIANRHALVAGLFAIGAVIAHDKWRRDGWRAGAWLAPLLLALGLLSSEMALATTGLLFAHALSFEKGPIARRFAALAPYLLVVIGWQAIYSAAGYGVVASGSYVHPLHEPLAYVAKLVERAPILSLAQLTPLAADFWLFYPPAVKAAVLVIALSLLAAVVRIAWPRLSSSDPQLRFWLIGAGLALLPIAAAGPGDRNLVFVGMGASAALAMLFVVIVDEAPSARGTRWVVGALAAFNLALAPLMLPIKCLANFNMDQMRAQTDASVPRDPAITERTLVVVSVGSEGSIFFAWAYRDAEGIPRPGRTRILATSFGEVSVTRLDDVTLRVRPEGGFLASEMHQLLRNPSSRPFHAGEVVELSNMRATVTEIGDDGRPLSVELRFGTSLESPEWLWMRGEGLGLVEWAPPRVGETVIVPASL